jgi:hypothetical protein
MEEKDIKKIAALGILFVILMPEKTFPKPLDTVRDKRREEELKGRMALPWSRDPFIAQEKFKKKGVSKAGALKLSGILWDETKPAAIIDDNIVSVGDKIGDRKVTRITKDTVVLEENGEEYILRLEK